MDFLDTPKMGFGCMRLPLIDENDQTSIDMPRFERMVDLFMDAGLSYFDTAHVYHDGASETALKTALVDRFPRESFTLATKCLAWAEQSEASAKDNLPTSLERMGVDYIDYYLLHNVGGKRTDVFDTYGMWDYALEAKEKGLVKHVGFSIHDGADMLEKLLNAHPEMEFVQLQVNYLDWDDPVVESKRCMEVAAAHDKPVIIMEPVRGGRLVTLPSRVSDLFKQANPDASLASWAYRFCWNLPGVMTVLSGASTPEQMEENIAAYKANSPFSSSEQRTLDAAIAEIRSVPTIPCTNCGYCVKDCPQGVVIPRIMALMNTDLMIDAREFVKEQYSWQTLEGPASKCVQCGNCESMCPQKIDIIAQLEKAVEYYE